MLGLGSFTSMGLLCNVSFSAFLGLVSQRPCAARFEPPPTWCRTPRRGVARTQEPVVVTMPGPDLTPGLGRNPSRWAQPALPRFPFLGTLLTTQAVWSPRYANMSMSSEDVWKVWSKTRHHHAADWFAGAAMFSWAGLMATGRTHSGYSCRVPLRGSGGFAGSIIDLSVLSNGTFPSPNCTLRLQTRGQGYDMLIKGQDGLQHWGVGILKRDVNLEARTGDPNPRRLKPSSQITSPKKKPMSGHGTMMGLGWGKGATC